MNKVEVICVCDGIRLPDLNLILAKGQRVELAEDVAKGSTDLHHARKVGGVVIRQSKGPAVVKDAPTKTLRRDSSRLQPLPKRKSQPPNPNDLLQRALEDKLSAHYEKMRELSESIRDMISAVGASPQATNAQVDLSGLETMLKSAMEKAAQAAPVSTAPTQDGFNTVGDSAPMFIPEGIVGDAAADLGTSEESSGFSVDEATEALKAMKRAKKTKKKGN